MHKSLLFLTVFLSVCFSSPLSGEWLPHKIHEVRAFAYDYTQGDKGANLVVAKNTLHLGVINPGGALLSKDQSKRLQSALVTKQKRKKGAFCYDPHHGFVFYDRKGNMMGYIELCFQCGNVKSAPKGLPNVEWNWAEIRAILKELKIPIAKDNDAYTKLYLQEKNGDKD